MFVINIVKDKISDLYYKHFNRQINKIDFIQKNEFYAK